LELFGAPEGLLWGLLWGGVSGFDIVADNTGMPLIQLTPAQRKEHRAQAHHLDPVVMIGNDGLTDAVQKEVDLALNAHGLIKVRVLAGERADREVMFQTLANALNAAPIQHIGKLLVLWRPQPAKEKQLDEDRMPGPRDIKVLKYSKRGGQRPEVKTLRVLGNQRLTAGGEIKRAKRKQVSVKKRSQT
jgi:RNA-binding protein